jgi:hypothetical protein
MVIVVALNLSTASDNSYSESVEFAGQSRSLRMGLLINPQAGRNRKRLGRFKSLLAGCPDVSYRIVNHQEELLPSLADFAEREVDVLAVSGGDGTVQRVLSMLFVHRPFAQTPLLAVMHSGTTNMIAGDVGIRGRGLTGLRHLISWIRSPQPEDAVVERPILRVRTAPDRLPVYGMFFGTAGIFQGIQFCRRKIHAMGLRGEVGPGVTLGLFLMSLLRREKSFIEALPIGMALDGGRPTHRSYMMLLVSTLERLFLGLHPFWSPDIGPLHLTAIESRPKHLLPNVPRLPWGRPSRYSSPHNGYHSHNVESAQFYFNSEFTVDGEFYSPDPESGSVRVDCGGYASFLRI